MAAPRKYPEFELTPKLVEAFAKAIGPTRMRATSSQTRSQMMRLAQSTAAELGDILAREDNAQSPAGGE